ncbi:MAG TPA: hypothetical protein VKH63_15635 [Candidatus Acidoferrum sp.]|nr:hypothetical protein [Candidatus Acidoferrum sp.]
MIIADIEAIPVSETPILRTPLPALFLGKLHQNFEFIAKSKYP